MSSPQKKKNKARLRETAKHDGRTSFSLSAKLFPNSNLTNEADDSLHVSKVQEPNGKITLYNKVTFFLSINGCGEEFEEVYFQLLRPQTFSSASRAHIFHTAHVCQARAYSFPEAHQNLTQTVWSARLCAEVICARALRATDQNCDGA